MRHLTSKVKTNLGGLAFKGDDADVMKPQFEASNWSQWRWEWWNFNV